MSKSNGSLKDAAAARGEMFRIDPRQINIKPDFNCRDFNDPANMEHVNQLSASIGEIGVKQPITVYMEDGKIWLSDGECRLRATMAAIGRGVDIKTIPAIAEDRYANEADKVFSQIIRNSGKAFSPLEQAKAFKKLVDLGWIAKDIAAKAGISQVRVSQVLDLLAMPEPIKQMVTNGQVSATMATAVLKDHNGAEAVKVLQDAITEATSQGRAKALPKDAAAPNEPKAPANKIASLVKDVFEYADVDNNDDEFVIIKMPAAQWERLRNAIKL